MRGILAFWILGIAPCWACSVVPDLSRTPGGGPLSKIRRDGKYGYMDRNGTTMAPTRFDEARDFFHGLAAVSVDGKLGYIDEHGRIVIQPRFDDARDFREELAPVRVGRRWGYVDLLGRMAIEPRFQAAGEFHDGLARIYLWDKITVVHAKRRTQFTKDTAPEYLFRLPFEDPCGSVLADDGRLGFIDKSGRIVIPPRFAYAGDFSDGLANVCLDACRDVFRRRFGFVDRSGNLAIPMEYRSVGDFSEGLARIAVGDRHGFIDKTGRTAIAPEYDFAGDFHDGLARVKFQGKWGYINRTGGFAIPLQFSEAWDFSEGLAIACSGVCTYIDRTGSSAVPGVFGREGMWSFSDGLAPVSESVRFTFAGLSMRIWNRILRREPSVVYIDKSGSVVGVYGR